LSFPCGSGEKTIDCVNHFVEFRSRTALLESVRDAGFEMVMEQHQRNFVERAPHRRNLLEHVDTISALADHLAETSQLPLGAFEPISQIVFEALRPGPRFEPDAIAAVMFVIFHLFDPAKVRFRAIGQLLLED
jgi:hypothetical protein